jgi:hypothetical protein|tara:strand:- start:40 stop:306 length:267 start_codon:yes stop_codon:yes gene_type:complete
LSIKRTDDVQTALDKYFDIQTRPETCRQCNDDTLLSKKFLAGNPYILMIDLEAFNHADLGAKRLKQNKPIPLKINIDKYALLSVDSTR